MVKNVQKDMINLLKENMNVLLIALKIAFINTNIKRNAMMIVHLIQLKGKILKK